MSGEQDDELGLEDVLARWREALQEELHTATVGRVERVLRVTEGAGESQRTEIVVDVRPLVRRSVRAVDDSFVREEMPILRSVRLVTPRTGAWFVHLPIDVGDFVLLVALERDPARAFVTGDISDPIDRRHHHLAHAVAIPGLFPRTHKLPTEFVPTDAMVLGHTTSGARIRLEADGGVDVGADPSGLAALASKVDKVVQAFLGVTPVPNDGGEALQLAVQAAWDAPEPVGVGGSVACSKTRIE